MSRRGAALVVLKAVLRLCTIAIDHCRPHSGCDEPFQSLAQGSCKVLTSWASIRAHGGVPLALPLDDNAL
jgi:hypothetical protein